MPRRDEAPGGRPGAGNWTADGGHRRLHSSGVLIYAANGRIIGEVRGDTLYKTATEKLHLLRKPLGWASDVVSLERAEQAGAKYIELYAKDSHKTYRTSISLFWSKGVYLDRGFGKQLALPLGWWRVTGPGEPADAPRQLWFWGDAA